VNAIAASVTAMIEIRSRDAGPLAAFAADLQRLEAATAWSSRPPSLETGASLGGDDDGLER
jgi:hypothetical protein